MACNPLDVVVSADYNGDLTIECVDCKAASYIPTDSPTIMELLMASRALKHKSTLTLVT